MLYADVSEHSVCSIFIRRWNRQSVLKCQHIKFRRRELPRRKHTTYRTRQKFENKNDYDMLVFTKITCSSYFVVSPHPINCATMKGKGTNISWHIIISNAHVQGRYMNAHAYEGTNTNFHK